MKRGESPLFDKSSRSVFGRLETWDELIRDLADVRLERHQLFQVAIVGTADRFSELLLARRPPGLELLKSSPGLSSFAYDRRFGRRRQHSASGYFFVGHPSEGPVYVALSMEPARFWRHGLQPLIASLYPKAAVPFLTQSELQQLLRDLQRKDDPHRLRIRAYSSKKRLPSSARKRFQSIREWTDADLDATFREAKEHNVWFRTLSFEFVIPGEERPVPIGISATLTKYGYFSCNGNLPFFASRLVPKLSEIAASRLRFFSNRERLSSPDHGVKPVAILYDSPIFKSPGQSCNLVDALRRFKDGTCSVLHANPYLHISLVDNIDFSSVEAWVLAEDRILLVPQIRTSASALKRIVNHIFENFKEGDLSEPET